MLPVDLSAKSEEQSCEIRNPYAHTALCIVLWLWLKLSGAYQAGFCYPAVLSTVVVAKIPCSVSARAANCETRNTIVICVMFKLITCSGPYRYDIDRMSVNTWEHNSRVAVSYLWFTNTLPCRVRQIHRSICKTQNTTWSDRPTRHTARHGNYNSVIKPWSCFSFMCLNFKCYLPVDLCSKNKAVKFHRCEPLRQKMVR